MLQSNLQLQIFLGDATSRLQFDQQALSTSLVYIYTASPGTVQNTPSSQIKLKSGMLNKEYFHFTLTIGFLLINQ